MKKKFNDLINQEFFISVHHQRKINEKLNKKRLQNMISFFIQQIVRQNLKHCLVYVV